MGGRGMIWQKKCGASWDSIYDCLTFTSDLPSMSILALGTYFDTNCSAFFQSPAFSKWPFHHPNSTLETVTYNPTPKKVTRKKPANTGISEAGGVDSFTFLWLWSFRPKSFFPSSRSLVKHKPSQMVWWDTPENQHIPVRIDGWRMNFPFEIVPFSGDMLIFRYGWDIFGDIVRCHSLFERISWVWYQCPVLQAKPQNVDSLMRWSNFVVIPVILRPNWHPKVLGSWFNAFWIWYFNHVCSVFLRMPPFKRNIFQNRMHMVAYLCSQWRWSANG